MKGLSRLYFGLNLCGARRFSCLQRRFHTSYVRHLQITRLQHVLAKEGPHLKDFLGNNKEENSAEAVDTHVPYVDEIDLHGNGKRVFFVVHGCQMNVSDTEIVWSILQKKGYQRTNELDDADVVLIVTCSVRETAEAKIWDYLKQLKAFKVKNKRKHMKVGILGCLAERLKDKVLEKDKIVDLVAGPDSYKDLPRLLAVTKGNQKAVNVLLSLDETYADIMPIKLNEDDVTAYVSIMRGCDNMCTYCIVPFTRGRERSRALNSILDEVKVLSEQGVKQITLLGQNVNSYRDLSDASSKEPTKMSEGFKTVYKPKLGGLRFADLLDQVSQVDPNMRIRFTSPHPKDFPDEVLYLIKERKNICSSIHLPAQSGSSAVLERMRRGYTREAYLNLVEHIRSILPDVYLSTDIIVGFCGETEEDHKATLDLLRTVKFNFVYFFPYSMREKTTAHRRYEDDVPKEVKGHRVTEIYDTFRGVAKRLNCAQVGRKQLVLVEGASRKSMQQLHGRNDGNIKVLLPACSLATGMNSKEMRAIKPGDYIAVLITDGNSQTLRGVPLYHTSLVDFEETPAESEGSGGASLEGDLREVFHGDNER